MTDPSMPPREEVLADAAAGRYTVTLVLLRYEDHDDALAVRVQRGNEATRERRFTGLVAYTAAVSYWAARVAAADAEVGG